MMRVLSGPPGLAAHPGVAAEVVLTPFAEVKVTHLGKDDGLCGSVDIGEMGVKVAAAANRSPGQLRFSYLGMTRTTCRLLARMLFVPQGPAG